MTVPASGSLAPILREVEAGLDLPLPDRVRILQELQSDLEELTGRFMADGVPVEEALARAREALVPDARSLGALHALHTPLYRRWTRGVGRSRLLAAERWALGVSTLVVLLGGALTLGRADLLGDPSPFLWMVMGLGGLLFAACTAKAFQLWVKRDHVAPGRGLGSILGLAAAAVLTGVAGVMVDVTRLAARLEASPQDSVPLVTRWLIQDTALLSIAILVALAGGLAWFALAQWVTHIEAERRDLLGINRQR